MRALCCAVLVLLFAPATVVTAQDDDPWVAALRARAEESPSGSQAVFSDLLIAGTTADRRAQAAAVALDVFPYETGNRLAAPLLLQVLREDHSHSEAWQLAYRLPRRMRDGLDLENGRPFLRAMIELYPDYMHFKYALADLLYDAGRSAQANAVYEEIVREFPGDTRARYKQAVLRELEGKADESLEIYDEIIATGNDLYAHRYKVKLLWHVLAEFDAADAALEEAFAAVDAAPPGRVRDEIRAELEWDQSRIADRRQERAKLAEATARTNRILFGLVASWVAFLGGGVVFLRRRRLL